MERSVIDTGSTMNINQSTARVEESAPSAATEFTTRQLVSNPVGISQNNISTVVDELKLFRELLTNLMKESPNETKSALIANRNQLEAYLEKIKETKECLTKHLQETGKIILALDKKLNGMTSAIERIPLLLQGETRAEIEKKWFDTIELTYPNVKTLENLIQRGVDVNAEDAKGHNALHLVCMKKNKNENIVDLVRLLIENGVDVNAKNFEGKTALHILGHGNDNKKIIDVVRLLVANGADVNVKDQDYGRTALQLLCQNYRNDNLVDVVRLLIENGADVSSKNDFEQTALLYLCQNNSSVGNLIDVVRLLIEHGVDVNAKNSYGMTALLHLCRDYKNDNLINIVRLFVENGVDVDTKDNNGEAPRDLIRTHYKKENAQEILKLMSSSGSRSLRLDNID